MGSLSTTIAVRAPLERTKSAVAAFVEARAGSLVLTEDEPSRGQIGRAKADERDDWSILVLRSFWIVPGLLVELSRSLATRVVTVAEASTPGWEHFSIVEHGETKVVYTSKDDVTDVVGVDVAALVERARREPNRFRLRPSHVPFDPEEYAREVYGLLLAFECELDLETPTNEILEQPDIGSFDISFPDSDRCVIDYTNPGRGNGIAWRELVEASERASIRRPVAPRWKFWRR